MCAASGLSKTGSSGRPAERELCENDRHVRLVRHRAADRVAEPALELPAIEKTGLDVARRKRLKPALALVPGGDVVDRDEVVRVVPPRHRASGYEHAQPPAILVPERQLRSMLAALGELLVPSRDLVGVLGRPEREVAPVPEQILGTEPDEARRGRR